MFHPFPQDRTRAILKAQICVSLDPLILDTETTGLSNMDQICEIAVVDLAGAVLINSLVKPTKLIPHSTSEIHGITNEAVTESPTFRDLLPELDRVLRDRTVLIYNAEYDQNMLWSSAKHHGIEFTAGDHHWWSYKDDAGMPYSSWHDVMEIYAAYYGEWNEYHKSYRWQRLSTALRQCKLELPEGIHRAHADAEMTRRLVLHMASDLPEQTQLSMLE